jgi:uncharacterized protein (TIGR00251 family)
VKANAGVDTCFIGIKLKPGAGREKIVSIDEREVCISVTAPPLEGKANKALIKFLAQMLDVPKSALEIKRGETSRIKLVEIAGMTKEEAMRKIRGI